MYRVPAHMQVKPGQFESKKTLEAFKMLCYIKTKRSIWRHVIGNYTSREQCNGGNSE